MGAPVVVALAGVPVGKGRPRFVRATGRAFTPEKTRSYEDSLRLSAQIAMAGRTILEGALAVVVEATVRKSYSDKPAFTVTVTEIAAS